MLVTFANYRVSYTTRNTIKKLHKKTQRRRNHFRNYEHNRSKGVFKERHNKRANYD